MCNFEAKRRSHNMKTAHKRDISNQSNETFPVFQETRTTRSYTEDQTSGGVRPSPPPDPWTGATRSGSSALRPSTSRDVHQLGAFIISTRTRPTARLRLITHQVLNLRRQVSYTHL